MGGQPASVLPQLSGKFHVLHKMLLKLRTTTDDRIVLVSNYTQADETHSLVQCRLQPRAVQAAAPCSAGCSPVQCRLQPYA